MRKFRSFKNMILKGIMGMAFVVFMVSGSALDSNYWMEALAVCIVSFAILALFAIANGAMNWGDK